MENSVQLFSESARVSESYVPLRGTVRDEMKLDRKLAQIDMSRNCHCVIVHEFSLTGDGISLVFMVQF